MGLQVFRAITKPKLPEQIENELTSLIYNKDLKLGQRLPSVKTLAKQFGVGERSIREALKSLQKIGLIEIHHGKGVFVAKTGIDDYLKELTESLNFKLGEQDSSIVQLFEVRKFLEAGTASLAAARATLQDIGIMEEVLFRQEKATQINDLEMVNNSDLNLHLAIANAAKNIVLLHTYNALSNLVLESRRIGNQMPGAVKTSLREHRAIFSAIKSKNEELAYQCMFSHINSVQETISRFL